MHLFMTRLLTVIILAVPVLFPIVIQAQEKEQALSLASPDWVHPARRESYPGYRKHEEQKQTGTLWQYSTNRPLGNIRGGGTTQFQDYRPFYKPQNKRSR